MTNEGSYFNEFDQWLPVEGAEEYYEVSNFGAVRSVVREIKWYGGRKYKVGGELIKPTVMKSGYVKVHFNINGDKSWPNVHRLVAKAFIENIENKPYVNHKNGVKWDNRVINLEWSTASENSTHSVEELGKLPGGIVLNQDHPNRLKALKESFRPILQFDLSGLFIMEFESMASAERAGFTRSEIRRCCASFNKVHKGFKWKYKSIE